MSSQAHRLSVEMLDETSRLPRPTLEWLVAHIEKAARLLNCHGEVRVRVVGDVAMAQAHEEFAGVPGTTDVLTFDMNDPEETPAPSAVNPDDPARDRVVFGLDTDILVCIDEGERHAAGGGYPVERELLLYVVHAMLHCLGMDDHEESAAAAMHRAEDAILRAIGVGPVYATPGRLGEQASK